MSKEITKIQNLVSYYMAKLSFQGYNIIKSNVNISNNKPYSKLSFIRFNIKYLFKYVYGNKL